MMCLNRISLISVAILIQLCLVMPAFTQAPMGTHVKKYKNGVYFWQYLPPGYDSTASKQYPLMIFLHGKGERCDTALSHEGRMSQLNRVRNAGVPYEINKGCNMCFTVPGQPEECFIVLSPQRDESGYEWPAITEDLLDYAMGPNSPYKINPNKMYITGLSMGGIGTVKYIQSGRHFATQFAAAAVAPGGGGISNLKCIMEARDIEFWAVHGRNDGTDGTKYSTQMKPFMDSVKTCNTNPPTNFYAINSTGHNVWEDFYHTGVVTSHTPAVNYDPNVYEWFLRNPKGSSNFSSNQLPIVFAGKNISTAATSITIVGKAVDYDGVLDSTTLGWSKIAGPSATFTQTATIIKKDSLNRTATITLTADGTYTFVLTSVDNQGDSNADTVVITKGPNTAPVVAITSPTSGQTFSAPATITLTASASDANGSVTKVEFFQGGTTKLGEDLTAPYSYTWSNVGAGPYSFTAKATDDAAAVTTSAAVSITVTGGSGCTASGQITRDLWSDVTGTNVADIPLGTPPTSTSQLTLFEGPTNAGSNYGARIRGYICPPVQGSYVFWISSDDKSELWLSTDDNPANKVKIAAVNDHTDPQQWTRYTTQQSPPITLAVGQRYYIEALHKEATGGDHLAVGWQLPNGTLERPIPGNRLSPYVDTPPAGCTASGQITRDLWSNITGTNVSDIPLNTPPTSTAELTIFEGPTNAGSNYGARIRGYICPPAQGDYIFWIASDDKSELWLSTDDNPASKIKIAAVNDHTDPQQWTRYTAQQSLPIPLASGQRYYIEALHKEATGGDHIAVGWQLPDGTLERPIPGSRLSPFTSGSGARTASEFQTPENAPLQITAREIAEQSFNLYPNPVKNELHLEGVDQEADVKIYNSKGMLLLRNQETRNASSVSIDVGHIQPGIYFIVLQGRQQVRHYKFIKE